jgi:hypothetical protein
MIATIIVVGLVVLFVAAIFYTGYHGTETVRIPIDEEESWVEKSRYKTDLTKGVMRNRDWP